MQEGAPPTRLGFFRTAGFATGDYANNLYWQSVSLFLMFFYTDALGLPAGTAGVLYMIASIWDGVTDPVMGAVADRTRTRWGRYRPYILFCSVPLGLSFAALYWRPAADGLGLLAVVLATHLVFRLFYTLVSVPYASLTARMTDDARERGDLAGFRMLGATLAGMTVSFATQPLVAALGGGDAARGFFYAACVVALLATAVYPLAFLASREPPEPAWREPALSFRQCCASLASNRAFWILMIAACAISLSSTALGKMVLYYFKYVVGDEGAARYALTLNAAMGLAIIPFWMLVVRRLGKRSAWLTAAAWGLAGTVGLALLDARSAVEAGAFFLFMHVASLGGWVCFWAMVPDTVEYGEWRSGYRPESLIFGLGMFFQKLALGLAAALLGWALDLVGYLPNEAQAPATLAGFRWILVLLPAAGFGVAAGAMLFYPLRRGGHERIVGELAARRA